MKLNSELFAETWWDLKTTTTSQKLGEFVTSVRLLCWISGDVGSNKNHNMSLGWVEVVGVLTVSYTPQWCIWAAKQDVSGVNLLLVWGRVIFTSLQRIRYQGVGGEVLFFEHLQVWIPPKTSSGWTEGYPKWCSRKEQVQLRLLNMGHVFGMLKIPGVWSEASNHQESNMSWMFPKIVVPPNHQF